MRLRRYREQIRPSTMVLAVAGLLMLLLVLGAAVFADVLTAHPPDRSTGSPYEAPSAEHLLGTDDLGRDLWSQLLFGSRVSLWVGLVAAVVATVLGTAAALVAGWYRGWVDAAIMRLVDLTLSLPFLVLVLVLAAYFGRGLDVLIVLIAGVLWARPARLLRGQVLKIREFGHTEAALAMGAGSTRIMVVHVLWRLVPLLVSQFVRAAAVAVIVQSGVAFLGLGDPGRISWGSTLYFANNGSAILTDAWLWWIVPPGVALTVLIVGLAFVGFAFEELADPQLGGHGWRPPSRRRLPEAVPDPCPPEVRLDVRAMSVDFDGATVVREADLRVGRGRVLGLVGESGSGKSTLGVSVPGLVLHPGVIRAEAVMLGDIDLRRLGRQGLERIRGRDVAIVPQAAMSVLDPTMTVLDQVAESAALASGAAAAERAGDLLSEVGLPPDRHRAFPHELSGGQRQRVVIAMAVANRPGLLIADEPTTGLDVVTQQAILDLLDDLRRRLDFDLWLISHDLPLVASRADDLVVMYGGRVVESGPARAREQPSPASLHVDAAGSVPVAGRGHCPPEAGAGRGPRSEGAPTRLRVRSPVPPQPWRLRQRRAGGASGAGSDGGLPPRSGRLEFRGHAGSGRRHGGSLAEQCVHHRPRSAPDGPAPRRCAGGLPGSAPRAARRDRAGRCLPGDRRRRVRRHHRQECGRQVHHRETGAGIGQADLRLGRTARRTNRRLVETGSERAETASPDGVPGSVRVAAPEHDGRWAGGRAPGHRGQAGRHERAARVAEALQVLGLVPVERFLNRHAGTLSGGQRQRVALARTLVASPELIVADEPASMLDASLRATVAAHLLAVRETLGATLVFITHDISLARLVADRIVVLFEGRVVEDGPAARLLTTPEHAETQALIDAAVRGQVPDPEGVAIDNAATDRSGR